MHTIQQLANMKNEHATWQSRIRFHREELKQFNNHLSRIVQQNVNSEQMPFVEHFQNQFIRQNEVLDIIRHEFKQHENLIEHVESGQALNPESDLRQIHDTEREKLDQFEKIFHDLRNEFNSFLNKTEMQYAL